MQETIVINIGPLTNYSSLVYYLSPKLKQIRELYLSGSTPNVFFDLRNLEYGNINISALTAFLSTAKRLRDFLGYPIPATIEWDPKVQGFLADIDFFKLVEKFKIFNWTPDGIVGGYRVGTLNPNTKLLYYGDKKPLKDINVEKIGIEKAVLKQKIAPNFLMRVANLFHGFDDHLEDIISNTALELIVNALMHAEDYAFVGLQRTGKRITVAVCDSGIGFRKSLIRSYNIPYFSELKNIDAIVIGCLIQKNIHGLRLAINEILNYNRYKSASGWVIISSFDSEIRWQKANWSAIIESFDKVDIKTRKPDFSKVLGPPTKEYIERSKFLGGYWRDYDESLVGTRITFEIQLDQ